MKPSVRFPKAWQFGGFVVDSLSLASLPTDLDRVADYLGLTVSVLTEEQSREAQIRAGREGVLLGWLNPQAGVVTVLHGLSEERSRMTLTHEFGHQLLRHCDQRIACDKPAIYGKNKKTMEREAFECGVEILLPRKIIGQRLTDSTLDYDLISSVADDAIVSFEATAMHLVESASYPAALVVIHHRDILDETGLGDRTVSRVKYSVKSRSFPSQYFFAPGTVIEDEETLKKLDWEASIHHVEKIRLRSFGINSDEILCAECWAMPYDRLFALFCPAVIPRSFL